MSVGLDSERQGIGFPLASSFIGCANEKIQYFYCVGWISAVMIRFGKGGRFIRRPEIFFAGTVPVGDLRIRVQWREWSTKCGK